MKECWKIQFGMLCEVLFGIGAVLSPLWHITSNDQNDAMATAFFFKKTKWRVSVCALAVYCHFRDITSKD